MKYFIVALVAIVALASAAERTQEQKDKLKEIGKKCVEETGVDGDLIKSLYVTDTTAALPEDNDKLNSYLLCANKKIGIQKENGDFDIDTWKTKLTPKLGAERAEALLTKCAVKKDTPEKSALHSSQCFRTERVHHH